MDVLRLCRSSFLLLGDLAYGGGSSLARTLPANWECALVDLGDALQVTSAPLLQVWHADDGAAGLEQDGTDEQIDGAVFDRGR